MGANASRVQVKAIKCFIEHQTAEQVHNALNLACPGAQASHDYLVVAQADDVAVGPCFPNAVQASTMGMSSFSAMSSGRERRSHASWNHAVWCHAPQPQEPEASVMS